MKPRRLSASWRARTKRNDTGKPVRDMERHCTGLGQSLVAVDPDRRRCRNVDLGFAEAARSGPLWLMAGGVGEIPDSVFAAGQPGQPFGMVTWFRRSKGWVVCRDAGN